jgi:hypothetical protein
MMMAPSSIDSAIRILRLVLDSLNDNAAKPA